MLRRDSSTCLDEAMRAGYLSGFGMCGQLLGLVTLVMHSLAVYTNLFNILIEIALVYFNTEMD